MTTHGWRPAFDAAIRNAQAQNLAGIADIQTVDDYLRYGDEIAVWAPRASGDSRFITDRIT